MIFGVDYSWGRPSVAALLDAGVRFACRYLSYDTTGKNLTAAEARELSAAGIQIVAVWQTGKTQALGGYAAGRTHAGEAAAQAKACGMPGDRPVYFAVDFDAIDGQQRVIENYLYGAAAVLGRDRVGIYGGYGPVKRTLDSGHARWGWQTYAWSGGRWDDRAHIQQYLNDQRLNGAAVDYDRAMVADYGQWRVNTMRFVSRAAWGARYGRGGTNITPERGGVTVHYVGDGKLTGQPHSKCAGRVRSIEWDHVNTNGWAGIAYTALVCEHNYVFEGRGIAHRTAANGTTSGNQDWYAVCALIGDGDVPGDPLKHGIRDAIEWCRKSGGAASGKDSINGHRDHLSTSCPGDRLYAWVRAGAPRPTLVPTQEETLKTVVDLGARDPQTIPAGERRSLAFEKEYLDPEMAHIDTAPDGTRYPSVFVQGGDRSYSVMVQLVLAERPGDGVMVSIASYRRDADIFERDIRQEDVVKARHITHGLVRMSDAHKYRVDVVNNSAAPVTVDDAYLLIAH